MCRESNAFEKIIELLLDILLYDTGYWPSSPFIDRPIKPYSWKNILKYIIIKSSSVYISEI